MDRSFLSYVKVAFVQKWNVLAIAAVAVAGIITGVAHIVLPILAAAEILYLTGLSTNQRFQRSVDAEKHKRLREGKSAAARRNTEQILESLSRDDRASFEKLKTQCVELKQIAQRVKGPTSDDAASAGGYQTEGMNRLLWIYLKLLYSKNAIERFFQTIDRQQIEAEIRRAKERLQSLGTTDSDNPTDTRRRVSLEDQLKTSEARLVNYQSAVDNYEFIKDEIARLSSKIASLAEMAINRQDTTFITSEVDSVSESVASSEMAMSELDFLTGWTTSDDTTPELLEAETAVEEG